MSFGQYRILALTLPTVAAVAVISILWFKHHQKKRRPRVDITKALEEDKTSHFFENSLDSTSTSEIEGICMSAKAVFQLKSTPIEIKTPRKDITEVRLKEEGSNLALEEPLLQDLKKLVLNSVDDSLKISCKPDKVEVVENISVSNIQEESKSLMQNTWKPESLELNHNLSNKPIVNYSKKDLILKVTSNTIEEEDNLSELEEGEIRSPDISAVKKHSRESLFKQDSDDSVFLEEPTSKEKEEVFVGSEETESDLEEGEIRSLDGRTEEIMKKETKQLAEKLASLELDQIKKNSEQKGLTSLELDPMKLDDGKSGSERDSANHSPSEVMLASPSISNFSDAHSEGSSDSGKGQSEAATSPSRTPAGGSSLAGDQALSVYEFVLPQVFVGRLIGRHGTFLHEIKTQTHTNIFIKRHPDSNKQKICAIEGTQQDIDKALTKIRQKFPLRRFPQLTLEKVSFVQLNPLPPLKPEDFHLQLVEGVNNDVVLSSLISAAHFFLQQPCHPSYASLAALNTIMTQLYSTGEAPVLETPVNYAVCAAPAMGGWYRAQIVHVEDDGQSCTVRYLDYGGYSRMQSSDLRQIRGDLLALPFQAVECYLANVAPPPGEEDWSEEARLFVQSLTCGQVLQAQVYDYAEDGAPLVYLYSSVGNQVVLINEELVVQGFAVIAESSSRSGTASEDGGRTDEEGSRSDGRRNRRNTKESDELSV